MRDRSPNVRLYSTIGGLLLLIGTSIFLMIRMNPGFRYAPIPADPENDSLDSASSLRKADSLRNIDSLATQNIRTFFYPSFVDFQDSLFRFHLTYDSTQIDDSLWEHTIARIDIYDLSSRKPLQNLITHSDQPIDIYGRCPILMEDMNFDGYTDLGYVTGAFINGCKQCDMWLYDPLKNKFIMNAELGNLFDPEFDPKTKLVYSVLNETNSPFDEERECFSWKDGKLILEHSETCQSGMTGYTQTTLTMKRRINGKLVVRSGYYDTVPLNDLGQIIYNWEDMK